MSIKAEFPLIKADFARRLRAARAMSPNGYKRPELTKLLGLGKNTLSRWENPDDPAIPGDLVKFNHLCELLEVTPQYLMNGTKEWEMNIAREHREFIKLFYTRYRFNPSYLSFIQFSMEFDDDIIEHMDETLWALRNKFRRKKL